MMLSSMVHNIILPMLPKGPFYSPRKQKLLMLQLPNQPMTGSLQIKLNSLPRIEGGIIPVSKGEWLRLLCSMQPGMGMARQTLRHSKDCKIFIGGAVIFSTLESWTELSNSRTILHWGFLYYFARASVGFFQLWEATDWIL